MVNSARATQSDARAAGLAIATVTDAWSGSLGGDPSDGSPLARDLAEESNYATERLPKPLRHTWAYVQTAGLVAHNHVRLLQKSLLAYANGDEYCPVSAVDTLTRVAVEAYAVQRWIVDPTIDTWERYKRWICLETIDARAAWTTLHEGEEHANNPALKALYEDADHNQLQRHPKGEWIGREEPKDVELVDQLLRRFAEYVPNHLSSDDAAKFGRLMYRMASGGVHSGASHVLSSLLPTGQVTDDLVSVTSYALGKTKLWQCVVLLLMAKLTGGYEYAAWIGRDVPADARKLTLFHIDAAIRRLRDIDTGNG